jgi:hypothetical protein
MVQITKEEAQMVGEVFGEGVSVYRTCRQKSKRHHYLMSCEPYALNAVKDYQEGKSLGTIKARYGRYRNQTRLY